MQIEISSEEAKTISEALNDYEAMPITSGALLDLMLLMLGAMMGQQKERDPIESAKAKQEAKQEEARRKQKALPLRSKINDLVTRPEEFLTT